MGVAWEQPGCSHARWGLGSLATAGCAALQPLLAGSASDSAQRGLLRFSVCRRGPPARPRVNVRRGMVFPRAGASACRMSPCTRYPCGDLVHAQVSRGPTPFGRRGCVGFPAVRCIVEQVVFGMLAEEEEGSCPHGAKMRRSLLPFRGVDDDVLKQKEPGSRSGSPIGACPEEGGRRTAVEPKSPT